MKKQIVKNQAERERDIKKDEQKLGFAKIRGKGNFESDHGYMSNPLKNAIIK